MSTSTPPDRVPTNRRLPRDPVGLAIVGIIALYRLVFAGRPSHCRFDPTCSAYGLEAMLTHGTLRGSWLTARRIVACRPGGRWGWDPVPAPRQNTRSITTGPGGLHGHH